MNDTQFVVAGPPSTPDLSRAAHQRRLCPVGVPVLPVAPPPGRRTDEVTAAAYHFTVGADESFPLPPPSLSKPPKSSASDSSADSGISIHLRHTSPNQSHVHLNGTTSSSVTSSSSSYDDRTAEWIGSSGEVLLAPSRRQCARMNSADSASNSSRSSTASSGSSNSSTGLTGSLSHIVNHQNNINNSSSCSTGSPSGAGNVGRINHPITAAEMSSSRLSFHSVASSGDSRTSLDRLDSESVASSIDVGDLLRRGFRDTEVLYSWLSSMHLQQLYNLFVQAGYDMPTVSRMTPEDLTAVGITQPAVRKRLTAEISKLNIADGIPHYKPMSVEEWLSLLCLDDYINSLVQEGYTTMDSVAEMTWEDLEDMGIHKLGHQKKFMLAIDRLKKLDGSCMVRNPPVQAVHYNTPPAPARVMTPVEVPSPVRRKPSLVSTLSRIHRSTSGEGAALQASPAPIESASEIILIRNTPVVQPPELVAIQVNRSWVGNDVCSEPPALTYESFRGPSAKSTDFNDTGQPVEYFVAEEMLMVDENCETSTAVDDVEKAEPKPTSSPQVNRPRPQIAPKPRVELRQRRASASEAADEHSTDEVVGKATLRRACSRPGEEAGAVSNRKVSPGLGIIAAISSNQLPPKSASVRTSEGGPGAVKSGTPNTSVSQPGKPIQHSSTAADNLDTYNPNATLRRNLSLNAQINESSHASSTFHKIPNVSSVSSTVPNGKVSNVTDSPKKPPPAILPKRTNSLKGRSIVDQGCSNSTLTTSDSASVTQTTSGLDLNHLTAAKSNHQTDGEFRQTSVAGTGSFKRPVLASTNFDGRFLPREPSMSPGPTDANMLPFANENVGTIRQRPAPSADVDSGSAVPEALHEEPCPTTVLKAACRKPERPVPKKKPTVILQGTAKVSPAHEKPPASADDGSTCLNAEDVFNDIDTMFEGLTQELDQLLTLQN